VCVCVCVCVCVFVVCICAYVSTHVRKRCCVYACVGVEGVVRVCAAQGTRPRMCTVRESKKGYHHEHVYAYMCIHVCARSGVDM
jgi:hypothetical protein